MRPRWSEISDWFERVADLHPRERTRALEGCPDRGVREEVLALCAAEASAGEALEPSPAYRRALGGGLAAATVGEEDDRGLVVGAWRLEEELGRGGMGVVWRARRVDRAFEKDVAVKRIKRGLDTDEIVARFRRERQVLAELEHPCIARLLDGGAAADGRPYTVLEYVEGIPVDRWCDENELDVDSRVGLFRRIAGAVHFAHQRLVVHRDLKPSNVLVQADGTPKLLDFGIAKLLDSRKGETGELTVGAGFLTPEYASPEQVRGEPITTVSDVYSLGALLYRLLTGRLPHRFETRSAAEVERVVCDVEPVRPSDLVPELGGDLELIVLKAMHKDPARRYASAEQLADDLRRLQAKLPVLARPDSIGYRTRRFVARNPGLVAGVLLAFALVSVAWAVTAGSLREARQARATAERRSRDLRRIAGELVFDLHDLIEDLPGATVARERVVAAGLRTLDELVAEAGDDVPLLREAAEGYRRLGDVLGRPTAANLGDTAGAIAAHRKAEALLVRIDELSPGEVEVELALCRDRIATLLRATEVNERALAEAEPDLDVVLGQGDAADACTLLFHRAEALRDLGRTGEAVAALEECLGLAREWSEGQPDSDEAVRTLQVTLRELADVHSANLDLARAESAAVESVELSDRRYRSNFGTSATRDHALALAMLARIRLESGQSDRAAELVERQLELFEGLAADDPSNVLAQKDLALAWERVGSLDRERGHDAEALESFRRCVDIDESVFELLPGDVEVARDLALGLDKLFGAAMAVGDADSSIEAAERMAAVLEPLLAASPNDVESGRLYAMSRLRVGEWHLGEGRLEQALAAYELSSHAFADLAEVDPAHGWTRRMALVSRYFVGWCHRELGFDETRPIDERNASLEAAIVAFDQTRALHLELAALGMLQPGDELELSRLEALIETCRAALRR